MDRQRNLLTTAEAADYLGLKKSYLYKLMMRREVPYYKPNRKLCFFDREELDAWLHRIRVATSEEIEAQAQAYLVNKKIS